MAYISTANAQSRNIYLSIYISWDINFSFLEKHAIYITLLYTRYVGVIKRSIQGVVISWMRRFSVSVHIYIFRPRCKLVGEAINEYHEKATTKSNDSSVVNKKGLITYVYTGFL